MKDNAITIEDVHKRFRLGVTHKEGVLVNCRRALSSLWGQAADEAEYIYALRDINLEVAQGEVLGIIGHNGAGKSTLLKILSRITPPTGGRITIRGKVASLLEVGTGFHPELTGRENIFLNGSILGMSRGEILGRFDEMIEFSGVEKFLDTPVKRYSSGMKVRLAFAVAAHLDPDILIIDEVLAVGDAEFQKKCIGKMGSVSRDGKTVLFVSHNMQAVESLCSRAILLEGGQTVMDGEVPRVLEHYYERLDRGVLSSVEGLDKRQRRGRGEVRFDSVSVRGEEVVRQGEAIVVDFKLKLMRPVDRLAVFVALRSDVETQVFAASTQRVVIDTAAFDGGGELCGSLEVNVGNLRNGKYPMYFWLGDPDNPECAYDVVDAVLPPLVVLAEVEVSQTIRQFGHYCALAASWHERSPRDE